MELIKEKIETESLIMDYYFDDRVNLEIGFRLYGKNLKLSEK